jgi:hypothetical protein
MVANFQPALQAGGPRFESVIAHHCKSNKLPPKYARTGGLAKVAEVAESLQAVVRYGTFTAH